MQLIISCQFILTMCVALTALLEPGCGQVDGASLAADTDSASRSLVKRQVQTNYYSSRDSIRHMGLDPYEERLLIALLGGCLAFVFGLVVVVICCRTYRVDRNLKGGDVGGVWGQQSMLMRGAGPGQMMAPPQAGRQGAYYPTGYQPSVQMDPAYLDPTRTGGGHQPQQHHGYRQSAPHQMMVDNTVYE